MSTKSRSEALRKMLAQNIEQSAATPAPLTMTGAGAVPEPKIDQAEEESRLLTPDSGTVTLASHSTTLGGEKVVQDVVAPLHERTSITEVAVEPPKANERIYTFRAMEPIDPPAPAAPRGEKLSVLLSASDLAILDKFHQDARGAGIKMRKGGNPSLFVRAALRLLDDVGSHDADQWANIVAATLRDSRS